MQYSSFQEVAETGKNGLDNANGNSQTPNQDFLDLSQFFPDKKDIQQTVLTCSDHLTGFIDRSLQQDSKRNIEAILEQISKLSPIEKLLLYLKLPTGKEYPDPLKQPTNPLGSRPEISQTIAWIKTHLKEDKHTSLPKQDVYNEYLDFCSTSNVKPLSTADFGKVMKQVYPSVRPRRLGTRGNSRYCYSGMTNRSSLPSPLLPKIASEISPDLAQFGNKAMLTPSISSEGSNDINSNISSDLNFMLSSKISRPNEDKNLRVSEADKRKHEEEMLNRSSKTPPERCRGRKVHSVGVSVVLKKNMGGKKARLEDNGSGPSGVKLPIPRLPKLPRSLDTPLQAMKKQKPLQPKPSSNGRESEFLESGNSLEQEEELVKYFRKSSEEEPKVSQLRMLLERSKEDKCARRRVSFETVPESPNSQKKFSFVPISPISSSSSFAPPKAYSSPQRTVQRSHSVSSPMFKGVKKEAPLQLPPPQPQQLPHYSNIKQFNDSIRSQSVPTMPDLPQITPVPSDVTDFTDLDTDSSNLLGIDESSNSLIVDANVDADNLNCILNIINDIEISKLSRSYPNTPTCSKPSDPVVDSNVGNSKSYPCTPVQTDLSSQRNFDSNQIPVAPSQPPLFTINLFDEGLGLDCEDTFNDFAREVTQLNSDVL